MHNFQNNDLLDIYNAILNLQNNSQSTEYLYRIDNSDFTPVFYITPERNPTYAAGFVTSILCAMMPAFNPLGTYVFLRGYDSLNELFFIEFLINLNTIGYDGTKPVYFSVNTLLNNNINRTITTSAYHLISVDLQHPIAIPRFSIDNYRVTPYLVFTDEDGNQIFSKPYSGNLHSISYYIIHDNFDNR